MEPTAAPSLSKMASAGTEGNQSESGRGETSSPNTSRIWTKELYQERRDDLASYGVSFTKEAVKSIVDKAMNTQDAGVRLIIDDQPALAIMKLQQSEEILENNTQWPTFVTLGVLLRQQDKVLSAWKSVWCSTLVVECEKPVSIDEAQILVAALLQKTEEEHRYETTLDQNQKRKQIVLVLRRDHNMVEAVKEFTNDYVEVDCKFAWKDLTPESQNLLGTKSICFQGIRKTLHELLQNKKALASKVDGETVWQLLTNGTVELGKRLEAPTRLNISRSLYTKQDGVKSVKSLDDLPKVSLITGLPGMGKSTLFTELAHTTKNDDWRLWIIRLNLLDCSKYLQTIKRKNTPIDGIAFLQTFAGNGNVITSFEEALFTEYYLNSKMHKIAVLLDGADEISPHYEKEVMLIIEKLQTELSLHKLCVSCRTGMKSKVESILHVNACEIRPFTKKDKINYLAQYWRRNNEGIALDVLKDIANKFLSLEEKSNTGELLTSIPLMIEMIADIHDNDILDYTNGEKKIPKTFNYVRLYNAFVERNFDIFLEEKRNVKLDISANKIMRDHEFEDFERQHMHAALKCLDTSDYDLITKTNRNKIEDGLPEFFKSICDGVEKTGIIDGMTPSNQPLFIHRTFIEYLQAQWIYHNHDENISFLQAVLFQPSFKVVNEMLNQMFVNEDKHPLHACVLNRDLDKIKFLLELTPDIVNSEDEGGRTALHLVAFDRENHASIDIAQLLLDYNASIDTIDNVLQWNPLQVADKAEAWAMVSLILKRGGNGKTMLSTRSNISNKKDFIVFNKCLPDPYKNSRRLLVIATKYGMTSCMEYLVAQGGDCSSLGDDGVSLMHLAARRGHVNVMKYLRTQGVLYTTRDTNNDVPMHSAVKSGSKEVLLFLLNQNESKECLNAQNDKIQTPLKLAIKIFKIKLNYLKKPSTTIKDSKFDQLKDSKFDQLDRYCDVIDYLLNEQEGTFSEDEKAELLQDVEVYRERMASLRRPVDMGVGRWYQKAKCRSTTKGQYFEIKLIALLFLRLKNSEEISEFHMASNVEGARASDDVVVKYRTKDNPEEWRICFIQLKHKENGFLDDDSFIKTKDFSLSKYLKSYIDIKKKIESPDSKEFLFEGPIAECVIVIYTNSNLCKDLLTRKRKSTYREMEIDTFLKSGSNEQVIFKISEDCDRDIINFLTSNKATASDVPGFLDALTVFSGQASEEQLDQIIKRELFKAIDKHQTDVNILYRFFLEAVETWWDKDQETLTQDRGLVTDTLKLLNIYMLQVEKRKQFQVDLSFLEVHFFPLDCLSNNSRVHVVSPQSCTKLSCTKLFQSLANIYQYMFCSLDGSLDDLLPYTEDVISTWSSRPDSRLIIVSESKAKHEDVCKKLQQGKGQKIIVVSAANDAFTLNLKKSLGGRWTEVPDTFQLGQLEQEFKERINNKAVLFQGQRITLGEHLEGGDD